MTGEHSNRLQKYKLTYLFSFLEGDISCNSNGQQVLEGTIQIHYAFLVQDKHTHLEPIDNGMRNGGYSGVSNLEGHCCYLGQTLYKHIQHLQQITRNTCTCVHTKILQKEGSNGCDQHIMFSACYIQSFITSQNTQTHIHH